MIFLLSINICIRTEQDDCTLGTGKYDDLPTCTTHVKIKLDLNDYHFAPSLIQLERSSGNTYPPSDLI